MRTVHRAHGASGAIGADWRLGGDVGRVGVASRTACHEDAPPDHGPDQPLGLKYLDRPLDRPDRNSVFLRQRPGGRQHAASRVLARRDALTQDRGELLVYVLVAVRVHCHDDER
jgi:hypothetical protein